MSRYVLVKKRFYYGEVELGGSNKNCHASFEGISVLEICKRLQDENVSISRQSIHNLIAKFRDHQIVADLPRRRKQPKITTPMKSLIEEALTRNDEITSRGLRDLLLAQWPDLQVLFPTIK